MGPISVIRATGLIGCVVLLGVLTGCAGRRISTSVSDQTFVPAPSPRVEAPVVEEAKVIPVVPVPSAPVEPAKAEPPAALEPLKAEPSVPPEPPQVVQPPVPARVEEARVTEPPIVAAPAPPPVPATEPPALPAPARQPVSLADVYFDFDQYTVRTEAQAVLEANARALKQDRAVKIMIEGHCDERGTLAYNMVLGERRANAAKRYLQELGVPASQLETVSYGKERPFCAEHSEACWQSNRRAHFRKP
jgi:peptidoglycan-associated lipoprotein